MSSKQNRISLAYMREMTKGRGCQCFSSISTPLVVCIDGLYIHAVTLTGHFVLNQDHALTSENEDRNAPR